MIYAPIIIPTLNRVEHLKRCIMSLQANPWAKYTTLIISVDFPPNQNYEDGYHDVCAYLQSGISGFADIEIIYQKTNLGAYQNMQFLLDYSVKKCDRYIFTEDDNEFSPNFIEYIDKGLDIFEKDEDIMAICATGATSEETENYNVVKSQNFAAHGYGMWHAKRMLMYAALNKNFYEELAGDTARLLELAHCNAGLLFSLQAIIFKKDKGYRLKSGEIPIIDQMIKMYLIVEHKYVVGACNRKARNWGYDGSGENCGKINAYDPRKIDIDSRECFEYRYIYPIKIHKIEGKKNFEVRCRIGVALIRLWFWKLCGGRIKL